MKIIKKIAVAVIALIALAAPAFQAQAQFRYAAVAGPVFTTLKFKQDLVNVDQTVGFQAGVQGELMFPGIGFGIDLGLIYNMAGANVDLGDRLIWSSQGYGRERLMLHQLNIPFHLRFKWTRMNGLEETIAPFVYGGPDFTILLAHSKCDAIDWAGGDLGLTAGLGVELRKNWQVSASYTWGMTYVLKTQLLTNFSARSGQWTARVAYFF